MSARQRLRDHFELSSGPVPPALEAGVRRHLTGSPAEARTNWVPAAAAVLLGLLAIGILLYAMQHTQRAVPAAKPTASAGAGWNTGVAPEVVPPVGAPVCGSALVDYVVTGTPPPASVTDVSIQRTSVLISLSGGYPSQIQAHLLADGSAYSVSLFGTTATDDWGVRASPGPVQSVDVTDPNLDGTHRAATLRVSVAGVSCIRIVPGARSITLEFSSGG